MKLVACWAVYGDETYGDHLLYTVARTRKKAIEKFTRFITWKDARKEGYRVSKFNLVPVEK